MSFKRRVAVVTGAAQGIGEAIARRLADDGIAVAILDIQLDKAREVIQAITTNGGEGLAIKVDITNTDEVKRAIGEVEQRFAQIDILVNNVGWDKVMPFVKLPEQFWDKIININLRGLLGATKAVLDGMISRKYGKIVNMASDSGRIGASGEAVYSACKGGVIAFTKTLAREVARYNINVNAVSPGLIDTNFLAGTRKEHPRLVEAWEKGVPMAKVGKPQDVAGLIAFIVSDEAGYITGQTISVNGGLTMV